MHLYAISCLDEAAATFWSSSQAATLSPQRDRMDKGVVLIIVKRLIQGRNNVTRVRVEPVSHDLGSARTLFQGRRQLREIGGGQN